MCQSVGRIKERKRLVLILGAFRELLKSCAWRLCGMFSYIFQSCLDQQEVPASCKEPTVVPVTKVKSNVKFYTQFTTCWIPYSLPTGQRVKWKMLQLLY